MLVLAALYLLGGFLIGPLFVHLSLKFEPNTGFEYHTIDRLIPTFILRGTRDEAALTIGLAQAMNMLLRIPWKVTESSWSRTLTYLPSIPGAILSLLIGFGSLFAIAKLPEPPDFSGEQILLLLFVLADLIPACLSISGYATVALAVGFSISARGR